MSFSLLRTLKRNSRPKIRYLISTAGLPNYGDEFITRAWIQYLAHSEPDSEVWLDCSNPSHASILFQNIHPNLHVINTLWQLVWNTNHLIEDSRAAEVQIQQWIDHGGTPREDLGIDILCAADSVHLLGGGYINQMWKANALIPVAVAQSKQRHPNQRVFCTGLGLSPMKGVDLEILRSALSKFDYIGVRDIESAKIACTTPSIDDAFLALNTQWAEKTTDYKAFICLQQDVVGQHPEIIEIINRSLLQSEVSNDAPIAIFEAIPPDDAWSIDYFRSIRKGPVDLFPFTRIWKHGFPTSESRMIWISSRFHMHLLGAASGAQGIALGFGNPYYNTKHSSLFRLGTGWSSLDTSDTEAMPTHAELNQEFPTLAQRLAKKKKEEADHLYNC